MTSFATDSSVDFHMFAFIRIRNIVITVNGTFANGLHDYMSEIIEL